MLSVEYIWEVRGPHRGGSLATEIVQVRCFLLVSGGQR